MSQRAHADVVVPRSSLVDPRQRESIRVMLYRALMKLGQVESVERFVRDPEDGPYRDGSFAEVDLEENAIVRIIGEVTPFS